MPLAALTLLGKQALYPPSLLQTWLPRWGQGCGPLSILNYCAGVRKLVELQMQEAKQCNKKQPIYLMWRDVGLNTGSVAVLSQMGLREQGLCLPAVNVY